MNVVELRMKFVAAIMAACLVGSIPISGFALELPQLFNMDLVITGDTDDPFVHDFFRKIEKAQLIFSMMPVAKSEIESIDFNFRNITSLSKPFGYNRFIKKMFITNLQDCDNEVSKSDLLPLTLHEVAHSIFWPSLLTNFPEESLPTTDEALRLDTCKAFFNIAGPKCTQATVSIYYLSEPFDELYADTAAVLADNDPKAMARAFKLCHKDSGPDEVRDFSYRYKIDWSEVRKPFSQDSHHVFDLVRGFIWSNYLKGRTVDIDKKRKILRVLFEASVETIRELHNQKITYTDWNNIDQKSLNQRLIQAVFKRLSAEKL